MKKYWMSIRCVLNEYSMSIRCVLNEFEYRLQWEGDEDVVQVAVLGGLEACVGKV